jgi:hypothetical protein
MTEATHPDRQASGSAKMGVAIAVGAVLVVALGVLAFRFYRSDRAWAAFVARAPTFAGEWAEHLRAGRLDEAYRETTAAFKARLDREAFGRWVADHPELKSQASPRGYTMSSRSTGYMIGLNGISIFESSKRLTYRTAFRPDGKGPSLLTIAVAEEGGRPLVDQAEIEPEPPPKP